MRRVLLDVDGVLADFASAYLNVIRDVTGGDHRIEAVTAFDMHEALGLSPQEAAACKRALGDRQGFARWLEPYADAQAGVRRLCSLADVYIVTSPWNSNATWTHDREAWLKQHFDIPNSRVVHTSAKYLVRGDLFVDDRADSCERWRAEHGLGIAVHWETPHNRGEAWDGISTRSWAFLASLVEEML